jgi:hypothetical protein
MKAGHLQQEKGRKSTTGKRQEIYNRKKAGNVQQKEGRKCTTGRRQEIYAWPFPPTKYPAGGPAYIWQFKKNECYNVIHNLQRLSTNAAMIL